MELPSIQSIEGIASRYRIVFNPPLSNELQSSVFTIFPPAWLHQNFQIQKQQLRMGTWVQHFQSKTLEAIPAQCFVDNYHIQYIDIPMVTTIGCQAFFQCFQLKEVNVTKLAEVGTSAFEYCTLLSTINLSSVEKIGENAFACCYSLDNVNLSHVKEIQKDSFFDCKNKIKNVQFELAPVQKQVYYFGRFYFSNVCRNICKLQHSLKYQQQKLRIKKQ
uniref:Leucine rich repeats-containing protein n=1 Tax=Trepomonas sp. PC1 TaxID=1076344 RepID=A0A146KC77_9EUKA|eukprot:JAP94147.1 Leucine rich repeats-containing protein [Trepomonas sp. PC1]